MAQLFILDDDDFRCLLSWLDIDSICCLDIAVGNKNERSIWLRSLHSIDSKRIDEYNHCHNSIRWLITRGARATKIRSDRRITDQTFAGVGKVPLQGFPQLTAIDFSRNFSIMETIDRLLDGIFSDDADGWSDVDVSDICLSAIAQGCPQLTAINLDSCTAVTDAGISAIAQGCPLLTFIDLSRNKKISDIGLSALAHGCFQMTSIHLCFCENISDIGILAIVQCCPLLTTIDLENCHRVTDIGVLALTQGCPLLTSI